MSIRLRVASLLLAAGLAAPSFAPAGVPDVVPDVPVLGQQAHRGNDLITTPAAPIPPATKVADGVFDDWLGESTRFGGTAIYSAGELVYQDYVMDDFGADDGGDFRRSELTDPIHAAEPRTYRSEALTQALGEQFGADGPGEIVAVAEYGDAAHPAGLRYHADIVEARVAADAEQLHVFVRTSAMTDPSAVAIVLLLDTGGDGVFDHLGGVRARADYSFLATRLGVVAASFRGVPFSISCVGPCAQPWAVGFDATDNVNGFEISIDRTVLGTLPSTLRVGIGAGVTLDGSTLADVRPDEASSDLLNLAFRYDEPARIWMDREQAFALRDGDIDEFLTEVDLVKLQSGFTESFAPRPGYYERVYESDSPVNREGVRSGDYHQGAFQHYGVYLPSGYRPGSPSPATWWTHYRGGHAHDAAAWLPGILRQFGEGHGNIVIAPGARGTSTWYVGRGHEDFLDVWDDSMAAFSIDPDRVYMSGYSMGGYASWLLPLVYPDRFAAAFPTAGPPTQGLWDGLGVVSTGTNDGRAREQLTFDIIDNAANLGYVIYHGSNDELVPVSGPTRMASQLAANGYRYRFYLFPGAEHYTNAIYDDWSDAAAYMNSFRRDPLPPRVVYVVKPSLELAVEQVGALGASLDYAFDGAYWVDGLTVRDGDPSAATTLGRIDVTSMGRGKIEHLLVPEAGAAAQAEPNVMTGLRWVRNAFVAPSNSFVASLENLATVELDLAGMGLGSSRAIRGTIASDGPTTMTLVGTFEGSVTVEICNGSCQDHVMSPLGGRLDLVVAEGVTEITVR